MKTTLMALSRVNSLLMLLMLLLAGSVVGCDDEEDYFDVYEDFCIRNYSTGFPDTIRVGCEYTIIDTVFYSDLDIDYYECFNSYSIDNIACIGDFRTRTDGNWDYSIDSKYNYYMEIAICENYECKEREIAIIMTYKEIPIDTIHIIQERGYMISLLNDNDYSYTELQNSKDTTVVLSNKAQTIKIAYIEEYLSKNIWLTDSCGTIDIKSYDYETDYYVSTKGYIVLEIGENTTSDDLTGEITLNFGDIDHNIGKQIKVHLIQYSKDKCTNKSKPMLGTKVGGTVGQPIDLGLSVLWSDRNLGAESPQDIGALFRFKETLDCTDYVMQNGSAELSSDQYSYSYLRKYDIPETDPATVIWGDGWRLPTFYELQELFKNTTNKQEQNLITIVSETNDTLYLNYPCYTQSNTQIETNYWTSSYDFGTKNAEDDVVCRVPNWTNFAIGTYSSIKISPYNACLIRPVKDRE